MTSLPQHTPARWHYARLLLTPLRSDTGTGPIDRLTLLQLVDRAAGEWYGFMGGMAAGGGEVEVVAILSSPSERDGAAGKEGGGGAREAVVRFSAAATHPLLIALPLSSSSSSSSYRVEVLSHSSDLQRVAGGTAGRGEKGYGEWVRGVKAQGGGEVKKEEGKEEGMVEG